MITPEETCPFGRHAKKLFEQHGFAIDEHVLRTRDEVEAFEEKEGVATTTQIYIADERIGGRDDLERYLLW